MNKILSLVTIFCLFLGLNSQAFDPNPEKKSDRILTAEEILKEATNAGLNAAIQYWSFQANTTLRAAVFFESSAKEQEWTITRSFDLSVEDGLMEAEAITTNHGTHLNQATAIEMKSKFEKAINLYRSGKSIPEAIEEANRF